MSAPRFYVGEVGAEVAVIDREQKRFAPFKLVSELLGWPIQTVEFVADLLNKNASEAEDFNWRPLP